jgi:hypothetical protein
MVAREHLFIDHLRDSCNLLPVLSARLYGMPLPLRVVANIMIVRIPYPYRCVPQTSPVDHRFLSRLRLAFRG